MTRADRDLLVAWIDANGLYNGTWDYTKQGCRLANWQNTKAQLVTEMTNAGCTECHDLKQRFEPDWFNLEHPEWSRMLRAPLAKADPNSSNDDGLGLGLCRARKVATDFKRLRIMSTGGYQHAVMPLSAFPVQEWKAWDESGEPVVSFKSTDDATYQKMLNIIRSARAVALEKPRVDMPGAMPIAGANRQIYPIPIPEQLPKLVVKQLPSGEVELTWPRNAHTWGLSFDLYRGSTPDFAIDADSQIATTQLCRYLDAETLEPGSYHYAIVYDNGAERSEPGRCVTKVRPMPAPGKVTGVRATSELGRVCLSWTPVDLPGTRYQVLKAVPGSDSFTPLTSDPVLGTTFVDPALQTTVAVADAPSDAIRPNRYTVLAVNRQGKAGPRSEIAEAAAKPIPFEPILDASDTLPNGGELEGAARFEGGTFDLTQGGHATFPQNDLYNLGGGPGLSIECRVRFSGKSAMPIPISDGHWNSAGWFLQQIGGGWRWHVGGIDCDGGTAPKIGDWVHIVATFDGSRARLYQDGELVADVPGRPSPPP